MSPVEDYDISGCWWF